MRSTEFPIGLDAPVEHDAPLPEACDAVVIGGGVIGVTAALYLRRAGLDVTLLEKGRIAAEQSSRNWGWIRVQGRDMAEIPIMLEARRLWTELDAQCGGRCGLRTTGVTYLAGSDGEVAKYAEWLEEAAPLGVDSRILDRETLKAEMPGAADYPWKGALTTPSDMRGEAWAAVPEIARLAASEGVRIVENCAVRGLDVANGRVAGVVTERGRIRAPQVLLAGGAWSSLMLRRHGITIPQLSVRSSAMATEPAPQVHDGAAAEGALAWRRRGDGGYNIAPAGYAELFVGPDAFRALPKYLPVLREDPLGYRLRPAAPRGYPDAWGTKRRWRDDEESPFEAMRILDPEPNHPKLDAARRRMEAHFPEMRGVADRARWAGMIDVMPDVVPVVDRAEALPGLTIATGMCGHGFGIGPGFGRVAADLVQEKGPGHDLHRFRLGRFSDGSPMVPGPSI
ncbi:FAD-dependent oxidoreductase [Aquicoccus sp. SCR17]|nr:FAD-dependent oxidoreductase [Carideicomes alvinocaridis]